MLLLVYRILYSYDLSSPLHWHKFDDVFGRRDPTKIRLNVKEGCFLHKWRTAVHRGIRDKNGTILKVVGISHRGFYAHVGSHTPEYQILKIICPQYRIQIGIEASAISRFLNKDIVSLRRQFLNNIRAPCLSD